MIDRHHLRYVLAVVDSGNFSRAAAACHVSQPTLSVGIARLETEIGAKLFLRTNRRTELTKAGVQFVEHARRIEREFAVAEHVAQQSAPATVVRLGVVETIPIAHVRAAVAAYRRAAGDVQLELVFDGESRLQARLDRGRLDAVLGLVRAHRSHRSIALLTEPYRLAMAPDHPFAGRAAIDPGELADNAMIVRRHCEVLAETSRYFTAHGVRPFMAARTTSDEQALACIAAGLGISVMPASYAGQGVVMPVLGGFDPVRTLGIILPKDTQPPELAQSIERFGEAFGAQVDEGWAG